MATLNFKGKSAVWNHHLSVPYHTLEKNTKKSLKGTDAEENLIIEGDNLLALKSLLPKYQGRITCIYIDPPYNTGNENWSYNDNVNSPAIRDWIGKSVGKDDLTRHDKWLCMMTPRIKTLRELLQEDGTIFISIDENEAHHLRMLMNEVFGEENFITMVSWQRKKESSNDSKNISVKTEYILIYSKSFLSQLHLLSLSEEYVESSYSEPSHDFPDGKWRPVPIATTKGHKSGGYTYEIVTPSGKKHLREWAYPEESYKRLLEEGRMYFGKDKSGVPQRVIYAHESEGIPASNIWDNLWDDVATNKQGKKEILELFGDNFFETPKPTALIKMILQLATDKDSIVLDSFAGSGTTAHAVMNFNKKDSGNRKFVLVQLPEEIKKDTPAYKAGFRWVHEITRERVKRVIKKNRYKTGFTYYTLGAAIDAETLLAGKLPTYKEFAKYVYYLATGKNHPAEKKIKEESSFVGKTDQESIYLIYKKNMEALKNLAITLDWTQETHKKNSGKKIVYAPACYLDDEALEQYNIRFVSIPYNLFEQS